MSHAARSPKSRKPRRSHSTDQPRQRSAGRPSQPQGRGRHSSAGGKKSARHREDVVHTRYVGTPITATSHMAESFQELGISQPVAEALSRLGATAPFAIQAATIPVALTGRDLLARGHTGSGKTIAFGAAVIQRLAPRGRAKTRGGEGRVPQALILAPTRELALQINRTIQPLARAVNLFTTQIVGGVPQSKQVQALRRGVDIVIGTPGRLEDLIEQGHLDLGSTWLSVVDEADHMAELGFAEPVERLLRANQGGGQKLFFSATLDHQVARLVDQFLVEPAVFELQTSDHSAAAIDHHVYLIDPQDRRSIIQRLSSGSGKTLVFTRTRASARDLAQHLELKGIPAVSLHGDLSQGQRQRNLGKLTSGAVNVLVATDVAARGIHVDDITLVIHADPAEEHKTYTHRSGRTGRAGKTGRVVTLAPNNRRGAVDSLLSRAGVSWTTTTLAPGQSLSDEVAFGQVRDEALVAG